MYKKINFRASDHSQVIEDHINQQIAKIESFLENEPLPVSIDVTVDIHKTHAHNGVAVHIKSTHYNCHVAREGQDIYAVINETVDKVYQQLRTQKDKLIDYHRHGK